MDHPLDGARLKVARAIEHLDLLKRELGEYLDGTLKPYMIRIKEKAEGIAAERLREVRPDVVSWWRIEFDIHRQPPLHLSVVIGDCINNLRSTLDYIAWALATRYAGRPLRTTRPKQDKIYFPLWNDPMRADRACDSLAQWGIPAHAIRTIKDVQPHNQGYELLALLDDLVNADKHRLPLLTITAFDKTELLQLTSSGFTLIGNAPTWVPSFSAEHPFAGNNVQVYPSATMLVTWQDLRMPREPVDRTLENFIKCVADVVPRFEQFF